MDDTFVLNPNTRKLFGKLFENAGYLLFVSGTFAAILLVVAVAIAAFRLRALARWVGWLSVVVALLLPLAIIFIGSLVFLIWVVVVSAALGARSRAENAAPATI